MGFLQELSEFMIKSLLIRLDHVVQGNEVLASQCRSKAGLHGGLWFTTRV